jgi:hypothetical protein
MKKKALYCGAGMVTVLLAGLVHGRWTGRWEQSSALDEAVATLQRVPEKLGEWKGQPITLDPNQMHRAGAVGHVTRRYEDQVHKNVVTMLLMCGRSGPMSVHTPEVCYGGAGYEMLGEPVECKIELGPSAAPARLWTAVLRKEGAAVPTHLRIFWGWRVPGLAWVAPSSPRGAFPRLPALYKLYVIREMASPDEPLDDDPAVAFIQRLLPELAAPPPAGGAGRS